MKRQFTKRYGDRGDEVYHKWLNKKGLDDTKPMDKQEAKAAVGANDFVLDLMDWLDEYELLDEFEDEALSAPASEVKPIHDQMNRREAGVQYSGDLTAAKADGSPDFVSVPAFKIPYVAAPKFEGKDAPIIIKAIVLEEGANVNGWRVVPAEFPRVAAQYKEGRQLRLDHGKDVAKVIGKSFDAKVIKGTDVATYLGKAIEGIRPDGLYVAAEFEANPQEPQVRTNILNGYVETGSIGLDASAFCDKCDKPLMMRGDTFERSCKHFDSPVHLRDVTVKEYSYVAEPAFPHTIALPSFSAALDRALRSSLTTSATTEAVDALMTEPKAEEKASLDAAAKAVAKAEGESESDAAIRIYKQGFADAVKHFRAKDEEMPPKKEEEAKAESEAEGTKKVAKIEATAKKTDQVTRLSPETPPPNIRETQGIDGKELMERAWNPTRFGMRDPAMRELFTAAAKATTQDGKPAPDTVRRAFEAWKREMPGVFE